jgi:cytosine/creatinine deaminase
MDLIVRNARLANRPGGEPIDIGVSAGKIVALGKGLPEAPESWEAKGRLVCAGLIETHIHLDKSRLAARLPPEPGRRIDPMRQIAAIKKDLSVEDIRLRAAQTLEECLVNGATRMRTQVEVDPAIGMRGFDAVQSLVADYQ